MKDTVYVKVEQLTVVDHTDVTLADVGSVWCENEAILAKCKALRLTKLHTNGDMRMVMSLLEVTKKIQQAVPGTEVVNLGENDFIIDYKKPKKTSLALQWIKTAVVCLIMLVGSGFAIASFNNDADTAAIFDGIYEMVTGVPKEGVSVLEITYCLGLPVGILLFYNHLNKRQVIQDPTPLEVEMRLYEQEIHTAVVMNMSREEAVTDIK